MLLIFQGVYVRSFLLFLLKFTYICEWFLAPSDEVSIALEFLGLKCFSMSQGDSSFIFMYSMAKCG